MSPLPDQSQDQTLPPEPKNLRRLRLLVTVLTATMILGLIVIIGSIVITLSGGSDKITVKLPETLALPDGEEAEAITAGKGWIGAVTTGPDGQQSFHILDPDTGALRQSIKIRTP